jgi:hypothetical protein
MPDQNQKPLSDERMPRRALGQGAVRGDIGIFLLGFFIFFLQSCPLALAQSTTAGTHQAAPIDIRGTDKMPLVVKVIYEPKEDSSYAWKSNFVLPVEVGLAIAIVSYIISYMEKFYRLGRGSHTLWCAVASEIKFCSEIADINIKDNLKSLSYRLPTSAYDNLFPRLLDNNAISRDEISHLQKFYSAVKSINRGLETATEHFSSNQTVLMSQERESILIRLKHIASKDGDYSVAMQKILIKKGAFQ